ncbi:MAG: SPOR domain-containing protein [Gammaproteobacteria bacterium]|nr:SPOR domain-containing protein [Gammaproteobacteria bacterium]
MDVRIRERLVGALVLVGIVVLLVPAVLKGPGSTSGRPADTETKSVEIVLDAAAGASGSERLVPEPEMVQAKPVVSVAAAPETVEPPTQAPVATAGRESQAATAVAGPEKPAATGQTAWAVQLGAFSSRSKADGLVAKLRARGYSAFVLEYRAGGQLLHRVRVGPEQNRARAAAVAERLRNDGFQPVVAPHP